MIFFVTSTLSAKHFGYHWVEIINLFKKFHRLHNPTTIKCFPN